MLVTHIEQQVLPEERGNKTVTKAFSNLETILAGNANVLFKAV